MENFKFRAWIFSERIMLPDKDFTIDTFEKEIVLRETGERLSFAAEKKECDLMLHLEKGFFQGDIIEYNVDLWSLDCEEEINLYNSSESTFHEYEEFIENRYECEYVNLIRVVGNVYENHNLLN